MKLSHFTLGVLAALPLAFAGCDTGGDEDSGAAGSTGVNPTTSADTMSNDDATSNADDSGDPPPPPPPMGDCQAEREIPAGPVDCSGASGMIDGSVIIEEGGDDPSMLEGVVEVTGSIQINRSSVTDLDFMACVQTVGGEVTIFGNDSLTNVDGLHGITSIGTDFIFSENAAIVDFNGLPNLPQVGRNIIMKTNDSLQAITGFHSLVGVNENLTVQNNPSLIHVDGLGGLRVVGGTLAITANEQLCITSVNCVGDGIVMPAVPPDTWSTQANNEGC